MKQMLIFLACLTTILSHAQKQVIYQLTFSDTSNFRLTTLMDRKMPNFFFIISTTQTWDGNRFWLKDFENKQKNAAIQQIQHDEHHPYFHSYLFTNQTLDVLISDSTKQQLRNKSQTFKRKKISLNGRNFKTISSSSTLTGFYFVTSEPLISDDKKFAFIDMTVFYKENIQQALDETYFGSIALVFQMIDGKWIRIAKKDWLIL